LLLLSYMLVFCLTSEIPTVPPVLNRSCCREDPQRNLRERKSLCRNEFLVTQKNKQIGVVVNSKGTFDKNCVRGVFHNPDVFLTLYARREKSGRTLAFRTARAPGLRVCSAFRTGTARRSRSIRALRPPPISGERGRSEGGRREASDRPRPRPRLGALPTRREAYKLVEL